MYFFLRHGLIQVRSERPHDSAREEDARQLLRLLREAGEDPPDLDTPSRWVTFVLFLSLLFSSCHFCSLSDTFVLFLSLLFSFCLFCSHSVSFVLILSLLFSFCLFCSHSVTFVLMIRLYRGRGGGTCF